MYPVAGVRGMKCPACGRDMEAGTLFVNGGVTQNAYWRRSGVKEKPLGEKIISTHISPTVLTGFRCRGCGSFFFQSYE